MHICIFYFVVLKSRPVSATARARQTRTSDPRRKVDLLADLSEGGKQRKYLVFRSGLKLTLLTTLGSS